jgi:hypothetical protein
MQSQRALRRVTAHFIHEILTSERPVAEAISFHNFTRTLTDDRKATNVPNMAKCKQKKKKAKKARFQTPELSDNESYEEEDEDNICRCICGDNDFTAKRPWIQCTCCDAWQHNECMDVFVFDDELGDHYWCELCAPELHVALLADVARGARPWESRCAQRIATTVQFEQMITAALEQVEWFWEMYEPQPSVVAGNDTVVPPKRPAPLQYVTAVRKSLETLLEDLPMQSLRDLAQKLDGSSGRHGVMKALRKTAAAEYVESDVPLLGILSELFG